MIEDETKNEIDRLIKELKLNSKVSSVVAHGLLILDKKIKLERLFKEQ